MKFFIKIITQTLRDSDPKLKIQILGRKTRRSYYSNFSKNNYINLYIIYIYIFDN